MAKNKIILIVLTFLIFACEDKEDDVNPLVGQWNMTDFSSGIYTVSYTHLTLPTKRIV